MNKYKVKYTTYVGGKLFKQVMNIEAPDAYAASCYVTLDADGDHPVILSVEEQYNADTIQVGYDVVYLRGIERVEGVVRAQSFSDACTSFKSQEPDAVLVSCTMRPVVSPEVADIAEGVESIEEHINSMAIFTVIAGKYEEAGNNQLEEAPKYISGYLTFPQAIKAYDTCADYTFRRIECQGYAIWKWSALDE